jgi:hypothetical protein
MATEFSNRELTVIELGLCERRRFLSDNRGFVPLAGEKLEEIEEIITKVRQTQRANTTEFV